MTCNSTWSTSTSPTTSRGNCRAAIWCAASCTSPAASPSPSPAARSPVSVPANDPAIEGQDISFPGNGTTLLGYQARPRNASGPLPLVLVCHENRGLSEHIRDVVRRFAKEGYTAFAVDLL